MARTVEQIGEMISLIERVYKEASGSELERHRFISVTESHLKKLIDKFIGGRIEHLQIQDALLLLGELSKKAPPVATVEFKTLMEEPKVNHVERRKGGRPPFKRKGPDDGGGVLPSL